MVTYDQGRYEKSIPLFDKVNESKTSLDKARSRAISHSMLQVLNVPNKFHDRAVAGQFNAYINLNKPIEARTCYDRLRDRLESHEELSGRLQLVLLEEHPVDLLKM